MPGAETPGRGRGCGRDGRWVIRRGLTGFSRWDENRGTWPHEGLFILKIPERDGFLGTSSSVIRSTSAADEATSTFQQPTAGLALTATSVSAP